MKSKYLIALFGLLLVLPAQAKLKVFILAGQSNMQGAGQVNINPKSQSKGKGSLEYLLKDPKTTAKFAHLKDEKGRLKYFFLSHPACSGQGLSDVGGFADG